LASSLFVTDLVLGSIHLYTGTLIALVIFHWAEKPEQM